MTILWEFDEKHFEHVSLMEHGDSSRGPGNSVGSKMSKMSAPGDE